MKKLLAFSLILISLSAGAQLRKLPGAVTEGFHRKYPNAGNVEWRDKLSSFQATFTQDGVSQTARFNSRGEWEQTEQAIRFDALPEKVREGWKKSHYNDWDTKECTIVWKNDNSKLYQVLVRKSSVQKKYLYFNDNGELVREALTI